MKMNPAEQARLKLPNACHDADFLMRLANQRGMVAPVFTEVSEEGPPHMKKFVWHCTFNDLVSQGIGPSKKEAKIAAAKAIKDALDYDDLPPIKPVKSMSVQAVKRKADDVGQMEAKFNQLVNKQSRIQGFGSSIKDLNAGCDGRYRQGFNSVNGPNLGVDKRRGSDTQKMPSLMSSFGMGKHMQFGNVNEGVKNLSDMRYQPPSLSNGIGFQSKRPKSLGSLHQMSSVNRIPLGLGTIPSLAAINQMQNSMSPYQQMPLSNQYPIGQIRSLFNAGVMMNAGIPLPDSRSTFGTSNGSPMPLMGIDMQNNLQKSLSLAAARDQNARLNLLAQTTNPYKVATYMAENKDKIAEVQKHEKGPIKKEVSKPTRETFMHSSFGSFHSDLAAGPSLENLPEIENERRFMMGEFQRRMLMCQQPRLNKLDKIILEKHRELCPKESELKFILKLVTDTEQSLKKVAEDLNKLVDEPGKAIDGMLRVGDLSKGLLMVGDRAVNLLLMCRYHPSLSLLSDIQKLIVEKLKEVTPNNEYQIHGFEEEAGFCVVAMAPDSNLSCKREAEQDGQEDLPFAVNVSLTSMSLSRSSDSNPDTRKNKIPTILDPLPKDKCVLALSEMRHSKWFSITVANMASCVECIRIVKDISNRDPLWNEVSDWAIEVMVERAALTAWRPMSLGTLLKRVMEMIAGGIILPNGPGVKDPCETIDVDVMSDLGAQQRENLTKSAQRFLRLIQFNQVYEILGLEPPNDVEVSVHEACKSEGSVSEVTVIEEIIPVEDNPNTIQPDTVVNEHNLQQENSAEENLAESSLQLEDNPTTIQPDTFVNEHNLLQGNSAEENLAESSLQLEENPNTTLPDTVVQEHNLLEINSAEENLAESTLQLEDNLNTTLPDTVVHETSVLETNSAEENLAESSLAQTLFIDENENEESTIENVIEENKVFLEDNENQESATGDVTEENKVEVDISNAEV